EKTFERRQTEVPKERPPGLSHAFATDATKSAQWLAYSEATEIEGMSLEQVVDDIWTTLEPIVALPLNLKHDAFGGIFCP
ncbi:MAG TPA: hypothetical protein VGP75_11870, partial [Yoonia sp.]|nr:hypothetical protein [Yoonia sp.]